MLRSTCKLLMNKTNVTKTRVAVRLGTFLRVSLLGEEGDSINRKYNIESFCHSVKCWNTGLFRFSIRFSNETGRRCVERRFSDPLAKFSSHLTPSPERTEERRLQCACTIFGRRAGDLFSFVDSWSCLVHQKRKHPKTLCKMALGSIRRGGADQGPRVDHSLRPRTAYSHHLIADLVSFSWPGNVQK